MLLDFEEVRGTKMLVPSSVTGSDPGGLDLLMQRATDGVFQIHVQRPVDPAEQPRPHVTILWRTAKLSAASGAGGV